MTATEQLIAKQVSDVFPASVDDLRSATRRDAASSRLCAACAFRRQRRSTRYRSSAATSRSAPSRRHSTTRR
jgi:hypothetical protein